MIFLSMTYKEIWDNLVADKEKVEFKKEYLLPKVIKEFRKERRFPAWKWYEYKIPSTGNQYIIFFHVANANLIDKPESGWFCTLFDKNERYVLKNLYGKYRHTPNNETVSLPQVHIYKSHFFSRYNQRFLKNPSLSANEIICRYFSRNKILMPIEINEEINKNIESYGEMATKGFRITDGFCFTQTSVEGHIDPDGNREKDNVEAMRVLYTTYMPESEMHPTQRTAIEKEHEKRWTQLYVEFLQKYDGLL